MTSVLKTPQKEGGMLSPSSSTVRAGNIAGILNTSSTSARTLPSTTSSIPLSAIVSASTTANALTSVPAILKPVVTMATDHPLRLFQSLSPSLEIQRKEILLGVNAIVYRKAHFTLPEEAIDKAEHFPCHGVNKSNLLINGNLSKQAAPLPQNSTSRSPKYPSQQLPPAELVPPILDFSQHPGFSRHCLFVDDIWLSGHM
jgi:hypothetical protein